MEYFPIALMFLLILVRVPVAFAIGIAALFYFQFADGIPVRVIAQRFVSVSGSFPLLAIPFFILAGTIMNHAGITRRLMEFCEALVGHMVGGLAQASVLLSTVMGGSSASAAADAAMQAKIFGPEMVRRGYHPAFSAAVVATSAVITPIIPPGIGLIIYAFLADQSVGRMFVAGIVPGILLCVVLMLCVRLVSVGRGYRPSREHRATLPEIGSLFRQAIWALGVPVVVILGIRYGLFTPTEAGAFAVAYCLFVGVVMYREIGWKDFPRILSEAVLTTSTIMIIIAAAAAFGFYMTWEGIPSKLAGTLISVTEDPLMLLFLINVLLILVGLLLETTSAIILLSPILVPVIMRLDIDPIHFGIVLVLNLTIGAVTPPVGTLMYLSCSILNVKVEHFAREALPFLVGLLFALFLVTYFPQISLFLPELLF